MLRRGVHTEARPRARATLSESFMGRLRGAEGMSWRSGAAVRGPEFTFDGEVMGRVLWGSGWLLTEVLLSRFNPSGKAFSTPSVTGGVK